MTFDEFKEAFLLVLSETADEKDEDVSEDTEEDLADIDVSGLEGERRKERRVGYLRAVSRV